MVIVYATLDQSVVAVGSLWVQMHIESTFALLSKSNKNKKAWQEIQRAGLKNTDDESHT